MRPVERGNHPVDARGQPKQWTEYRHARGDLIGRLGEYCSYCEMHLDAALAVEHVLPKSIHPTLKLAWKNFLLGCTNCNSSKSSKPIRLSDYFWPDVDNTYRAFIYGPGALISVNSELTPAQRQRAQQTLALTGLDKIPTNDPAAKDRRWLNRHEAWGRAKRAKERLQCCPTREMREQIVETAVDKGYWSIWMTVFADDADMRKRLIEAFVGTAACCFDPNTLAPVQRGNGAL